MSDVRYLRTLLSFAEAKSVDQAVFQHCYLFSGGGNLMNPTGKLQFLGLVLRVSSNTWSH